MSQVFHQKLKIISNQGKHRGLFISGYGLNAQPFLKQPWVGSNSVDRKAGASL